MTPAAAEMERNSVSIITPVYNGDGHLLDAVASVLTQTYQNWEWIVVNDGSRDGTRAILDSLSDPRIRIVHQDNAGASAARNTGLDMAQGEFVTFLDADDRLPPQALQLRAELLARHPDVDIVNGAVQITSDGQTIRHYSPSRTEGPLFPELARLNQSHFFGINYMFRRNKLGDRRFHMSLSHCEDIVFFLTLAHDADLRYGAVGDDVYEYRFRQDSAMSNLDGIEGGYMTLLEIASALTRFDSVASAVMQRRIHSILVKSWLRRCKPLRALAVPGKIRRAVALRQR